MRRRFKTRRRNKQRKIIIISVCCLLLIMTVGYAAMQTNLSINAKGNILQNTIDITDNIVDSGDGLYIDTYETEGTRYVYKGANPNNFIEFNNELWRIISKEADGTYKIIRNDSIGEYSFDTSASCPVAYNNVKKEGNTTIIDNIIYLVPEKGDGCNNWSLPTTLNSYLNEEYYNTLISNAKKQIINHNFGVGAINSNNNDLLTQIENENSVLWEGNIGLISVSDYLRANTNTIECESFMLNNSNNDVCKTTNWIYNIVLSNNIPWTITPVKGSSILVFSISSIGISTSHVYNILSASQVIPVLYLSSDIKIVSGTGTEADAYQIEL